MSRRAVALGVGAALLVLLLWWFLLWRPQRDDISAAKDRRDIAEQQASQLRMTLSRLRDLQQSAALTRSRIEALRVAVPDQPNLAQFILDANDAANKAGIDFLSVSPSPPAATAPSGDAPAAAAPASITLAMNVTGGYFQVLDFLNRLADLPRIVVVDNLSLAAGGAGGASNLTVTITARMFTTSTPAAAGATTTTTRPSSATATTTTVAVSGAGDDGATTTGAP